MFLKAAALKGHKEQGSLYVEAISNVVKLADLLGLYQSTDRELKPNVAADRDIIILLGLDPNLVDLVKVIRTDDPHFERTSNILTLIKHDVGGYNASEERDMKRMARIALEFIETFTTIAHLYTKFMYKKIKDTDFYILLTYIAYHMTFVGLPLPTLGAARTKYEENFREILRTFFADCFGHIRFPRPEAKLYSGERYPKRVVGGLMGVTVEYGYKALTALQVPRDNIAPFLRAA